jgi:1-acyl-sn-glycerol-3-phosphate acyltransferase
MTWFAKMVAWAIILFARLLTGMQAHWNGCRPAVGPRIYFGNHRSHGDFVLIWGCLPPSLRALTRPVAGADYWNKSSLRRFIGRDVFRALLIERTGGHAGGMPDDDPVTLMKNVVQGGDSLILFPEGTRNTTDEPLLPFKSGIYHLARAVPVCEFVPVWIDNLNRVMPKGELIPVPLLCTVTFGEPLQVTADEDKDDFLARCRNRLMSLAPAPE